MKKNNCPNVAKNLFILLIVSLVSVVYFQGNVYALTSDNINFQGKIVRNDIGYEGLNVVPGSPACVVGGAGNDTCDFQVAYYSAPSGGTLLLTETFSNVEIGQYDGVFELSLGSGSITTTSQCRDGTCNTPSEVISEYKDLYLELKFAPDGVNLTETFTRMPLEASPYAILSKYSEGANDAFKLSTSVSSQSQASPTTGMLYYNTTTSQLTVYDGDSWEGVKGSLWSDAGTFTYLTSITDDLVLGASTVSDSTFFFDMDGSSGSYLEIDDASNTNRLLTILSGGNVGIGTATPGAKLEVAGTNSTITNASGDLTISTGGLNGDILFTPNGTGRVGILDGTRSYYTYLRGGTQTADISYTLPTSSTNGLLRNTAGVLSWDTSAYITGLDWSQVTNSPGIYMDYKPNDTACSAGQVLKYTVGTGWTCADDINTDTNTDVLVAIDSSATAGYLGATGSDGVLRASSPISYTDGGDFVTLGIVANSITGTHLADDTLDYVDFQDTLDLDSALTLNQASNIWTQNFTGTTTTGYTYNANSLTTGTANLISSTSTAGSNGGSTYLLRLARSGANANTSHTAYGIYSTVTNTNATGGTNIAGYFSASGAITGNYGLIVAAGNTGIGTITPTQLLDINGATRLRGQLYDYNNEVGTPGQVLSTTTTGVDWIPLPAGHNAVTITGENYLSIDANQVITASDISLTANVTGILGITNGGTNSTTYTSSQFLWYNGTSIVASGYNQNSFALSSHSHNWSHISNYPGIYMNYKPGDTACSANQVLKYDSGNSRWVCADDNAGTGGDNWGTQFVISNSTLVGNGTSVSPLGINLANSNTWIGLQTFRGILIDTATSTDDRISINITNGGTARFDGTLTNADLTAARTWTLPNAGGTLALGTGTANYVAYWSGTNTLTAEQYLATSRGGLGANVTATGAGEIVYSTGTTTYDSLTAGTSGQILKSAGAAAPTWNTAGALTKTDDTNVTLTLGGSASTALVNSASITVGWSGTLATTRGGTGQGSYATGDILYASSSSALSRRAIGNTGDVLTVSAGVPTWVAPAAGHNAVTITGENYLSIDANQVITASDISLTANVTGILGITNGGTNSTTYTSSQFLWYNGTSIVASGYNQNSFALSSHSHNWSHISNYPGIYMNYKPGDTACSANQVLKYDSGNSRWVCADDNAGTGGDNWGTQFVISNSTLVGNGTSVSPLGINLANSNTWIGLQTFRGILIDTATSTDDRISINITNGGTARFDGTLTNIDLTATRTWTLPDTTGVIVINPMTTAGDIIYGGTSGAPARLAGSTTNGYVLKYNTSTNLPYWAVDIDTDTDNQRWDEIVDPLANKTFTMGTRTTDFQYNTFTSGSAYKLSSTATGFTGSLLDVTLSGSNGANTGTLVALNNTGTLNTNTSFLINHYAAGTGNLAFRVNDISGDTTPFVIDGNGNVGIGVMDPSSKLVVNTSGYSTIELQYNDVSVVDIFSNVSSNIFIGLNSGSVISSGIGNVALGDNALSANTTGLSNTAIGHYALDSNVAKQGSTALGYQAMMFADSTTTAGLSYNTAIGYQALTGSGNSANNTGTSNTAVGHQSMNVNTSGSQNTAIGVNTLNANTLGSQNVAIGQNALFTNVAKQGSVAIGYEAMRYADSTTTAELSQNTAVGYQALMGSTTATNNTGTMNSVFGYQSGYSMTSGYGNTFMGLFAGYANTTGDSNVAIGISALRENITGTSNVAIGSDALGVNSIGSHSFTVAIGGGAMAETTVGTMGNIGIGQGALMGVGGNYNIAVGYHAGVLLTAGSYNIIIGSNTEAPSATGSYQLNIGNSIYGDLSNDYISIGDSTPTEAMFTVGATSQFRVDSNGDLIRIKDVPYTWPSSNASGILANDGYGTLSWSTIADLGGVTGKGLGSSTAGQVAWWDSTSSITGEDGFWWDATNNRLGIGTSSPTASIDIAGASSTISNASGNITITPASNLIISSGSVGIGTTTMTTKLNVSGGTYISGQLGVGVAPSSSYGIRSYGSTAAGYFYDTNGTSTTYVAYGSYGIYTAQDGYFGGNVGIGTTTMTSKLNVSGSTYISGQLGIGVAPNSTQGITSYGSTMGGYFYDTGGTSTTYLAYDSYGIYTAQGGYFGGNVGIGVGTPGSRLEIWEPTESKPGGVVAATTTVLKLSRSGTSSYAWTENAEFRIGHGGPSIYGSKLDLFINGASNSNGIPDQHVMTWNYDGNVGIGTTSPSYRLDVNGAIRSNSEIISVSGNAFRAVNGNYGFFIRNDGNSTYFMLTNSGDPYGSWNSLRPMAINDTTGYVTFGNGHGDISERFNLNGTAVKGMMVSAEEESKEVSLAQEGSAPIGVVSTAPAALMGFGGYFEVGHDSKEIYTNEIAPIALVGTVPVIVATENGHIHGGDSVSVSKTSGVGAKAIKSGYTVGTALESTSDWNDTVCPVVSSVESINWPIDKTGENLSKPCFKLPDGTYIGKILVVVGTSWYDATETYTTKKIESGGWYRIAQLNGTEGNAKFKIKNSSVGSYQNILLNVDTISNKNIVNVVSNFTSGGYDISKARINNVGGIKYLEIYLEEANNNSMVVNINEERGDWISTSITKVTNIPSISNEFAFNGVLFGVSDMLRVEQSGLKVGGDLMVSSTNSNIGDTANRWNDIYAKGAIRLGSGSGQEGAIRFNSDTKRLELSNDGSTWIQLGDLASQIVISPEYPGAILFADGSDNLGKMTSDAIEENSTFRNYYEWISDKEVAQDYDILVRITLPNDFVSWKDDAIYLDYMTENSVSIENNSVDVTLIGSSGVDAQSLDHISTLPGGWERMSLKSLDINECNKAGDSCTLRISLTSSMEYFVRVGDITLNYNRSL